MCADEFEFTASFGHCDRVAFHRGWDGHLHLSLTRAVASALGRFRDRVHRAARVGGWDFHAPAAELGALADGSVDDVPRGLVCIPAIPRTGGSRSDIRWNRLSSASIRGGAVFPRNWQSSQLTTRP